MLAYFLALKQSLLLRDHVIRNTFLVAAVLNLASWMVIAWTVFFRLPGREVFALHITPYFGIDLVGAKWKMFFYPAVGLGIILANAAVTFVFGKRDIFLARSGAVVAALSSAALLLGSFFVVLLNL